MYEKRVCMIFLKVIIIYIYIYYIIYIIYNI